MRHKYGSDTLYPTVNLAVSKSRLKLYDSKSEFPTYFLNKGQEFQIELFNPTKDVVLAKIKLNGKTISGGGLVLQPGQRIFLERFLEDNKKFLFDTYEVDNIEAVKEAIKENGDITVDFYKEKQITITPSNSDYITYDTTGGGWWGNASTDTVSRSADLPPSTFTVTSTNGTIGLGTNTPTSSLDVNGSLSFSNTSLDLEPLKSTKHTSKTKRFRSFSKEPKTIETGRITKGSKSNQKFQEVELEFEWSPFHTVSYKMKPKSQMRYDSTLIVRKHCKCGKKLKPKHKFCPSCGREQ